jgi:hypothetical protein
MQSGAVWRSGFLQGGEVHEKPVLLSARKRKVDGEKLMVDSKGKNYGTEV